MEIYLYLLILKDVPLFSFMIHWSNRRNTIFYGIASKHARGSPDGKWYACREVAQNIGILLCSVNHKPTNTVQRWKEGLQKFLRRALPECFAWVMRKHEFFLSLTLRNIPTPINTFSYSLRIYYLFLIYNFFFIVLIDVVLHNIKKNYYGIDKLL